MTHRIAVIDLGTNTFHLAIADVSAGQVHFLHREQRFVKLAEHGIDHIGEEPFQRGLKTLSAYSEIMAEHGVEKTEAVATAALRTARNGTQFIGEARKLGFDIRLITGEEEAKLIWRGVRAATQVLGKALVLDIGGGSAEFIIANGDRMISVNSFPIGGAVLRRKFHRSDPISRKDIADLDQHLEETIGSLFDHPVDTLVGASGTFESIAAMVNVPLTLDELFRESTYLEISLSDFALLRDKLIGSTIEDRLNWPGLIPERADMVVVATLLVDHVLRKTEALRLIVSSYALKEGLMWAVADSLSGS